MFSDFTFVAARFFTDVGSYCDIYWFTYTTPLNFTHFKGIIHQSLQWNVCATHVINFFSNLVDFFWKLWRRRRAVVATRVTESAILSRKVQLIQFLAIFFLRFFSCRHRNTCARVATRVIFTTRWRRDKFRKKTHHHRKQKIARVAAALNITSHDEMAPRSFTSR